MAIERKTVAFTHACVCVQLTVVNLNTVLFLEQDTHSRLLILCTLATPDVRIT